MERVWNVSIKYLVAFSIPFAFIFAATKNIFESFKYGHDSWAITDLLINYQGGFVRRGLLGEIFYQIGSFTGIPINIVAIVSAALAFITVLFYFCTKGHGKIPLLLLLSPALLGSSALGSFIIRKDYFTILFVIALVRILNSQTRWKYILANTCIFLGALNHEAFIFLAIATILVGRYPRKEKQDSPFLELLRYPSLSATFLLVVLVNGNSEISSRINQSLLATWENISGIGCCKTPEATIGSLSWSTSQAFALPRDAVTSFSHGVWVPLGWIISFIVIYLAIKWNIARHLQEQFHFVFSRTLLCFIPIIAIGWDYGRWAFLISTTSIVFLVENMNFQEAVSGKDGEKKTYARAILLFTSTPICCWGIEVATGSTPLGWLWFNIIKPFLLSA